MPCGDALTTHVAEVCDGVPRHAPDLVLAFARKIIRPGGKVLLLTSDNRADGWVPLEKAIASRRAFAVEVAADILAIDCDRPELAPSVADLAEQLHSDGIPPVVVSSGRPAHLH